MDGCSTAIQFGSIIGFVYTGITDRNKLVLTKSTEEKPGIFFNANFCQYQNCSLGKPEYLNLVMRILFSC